MLPIKHVLFLIFGCLSFIIFYVGFLNYITSSSESDNLEFMTTINTMANYSNELIFYNQERTTQFDRFISEENTNFMNDAINSRTKFIDTLTKISSINDSRINTELLRNIIKSDNILREYENKIINLHSVNDFKDIHNLYDDKIQFEQNRLTGYLIEYRAFYQNESTRINQEITTDIYKLENHGYLILLFTIIVAIGTCVAAIQLTQNITNPIEKLSRLMNEFTALKKSSIKPIKTQIKEFHELSENFLRMTNSIEKTIDVEKRLIITLKEIDRQKDEFASMISHELKTPLVAILGYVNMLKRENFLGSLNSNQIKAVKEIEIASKTLENLIGDILMAQKLGMGKWTYYKENVSIEKLIDESINSFIPISEYSKIKFIKNCNMDYVVHTDKARIIQVLSNLIKNSINYISKENGIIEVGVIDKDSKLQFYVKDNGVGIPIDKQSSIFKKFYQADNSLKRNKTGTGLGLAISKNIIEDLGGDMAFESIPDQYTIFYFTIPKNPIPVKTR